MDQSINQSIEAILVVRLEICRRLGWRRGSRSLRLVGAGHRRGRPRRGVVRTLALAGALVWASIVYAREDGCCCRSAVSCRRPLGRLGSSNTVAGDANVQVCDRLVAVGWPGVDVREVRQWVLEVRSRVAELPNKWAGHNASPM
jgi:hypothetical protein